MLWNVTWFLFSVLPSVYVFFGIKYQSHVLCPYIFRSMLLSTCLDEFCHFPIAYPVALTSVTCRGCGQTHSVESFTAKTPLNHIPTKLQNLIKSILLENQAPKRSAETVSSSNSTTMLGSVTVKF